MRRTLDRRPLMHAILHLRDPRQATRASAIARDEEPFFAAFCQPICSVMKASAGALDRFFRRPTDAMDQPHWGADMRWSPYLGLGALTAAAMSPALFRPPMLQDSFWI